MKKKTVLAISLTLLLIGMLTLAFNIQPVKAEPGTWTVDDDGPADFHAIQEAINAASDGDTIFVHTGTYYENVVVNKTVSLIGEDTSATIIDGNGTGIVVFLGANNASLSSFTVRNGDFGIYVSKYPTQLSHNNISYNAISDNEFEGIYILGSTRTIIVGNNITGSRYGITLHICENSYLRNNRIWGNKYNLRVMLSFIHDIDTSNVIEDKPVYYWVNQHNRVVPTDAGYVGIVNSSNILVKDLEISHNNEGVLIADSSDCRVENVTSLNNYIGVVLRNSERTVVAGSKIMDNVSGIGVAGNNSIVMGNTITNNTYGISLGVGSSSNNITRNTVTNNTWEGINLRDSDGNSISENTIINNKHGIYLTTLSDGNTIISNTITNNHDGIVLDKSRFNTIYHNNFINNTNQAYVTTAGYTNTWDYGYPSGGNYWSDYSGVDMFSGPYQNVIGSDGIGDTPYVIYENNQDRYPLMTPASFLYYELLEKYNNLLADYDNLNSTYYTLLSNYVELQGNYDSLNSSYNNLNATYDELKSEQEATISELNSIRNVMYIFIATTIIFIATTVYLAIRKPKVKPELKAT